MGSAARAVRRAASLCTRTLPLPQLNPRLPAARTTATNTQNTAAEPPTKQPTAAMSAPASGPFWRAAGMSYLQYANICADMLRSVLKEPAKSKALQRQAIYYRSSKFVDGKQSAPGEPAWGAVCRGRLYDEGARGLREQGGRGGAVARAGAPASKPHNNAGIQTRC